MGIEIDDDTCLDTPQFADDQVICANEKEQEDHHKNNQLHKTIKLICPDNHQRQTVPIILMTRVFLTSVYPQ